MKLFHMAFYAAMRALRRNKLRSSLTILGMVIGVAAVIATVGIGQGAGRAIQDQIASMGTNLLVIMAGTNRRGGAHGSWGGATPLTTSDARAIEREATTIEAVSYGRSGAIQGMPNNRSDNLAVIWRFVGNPLRQEYPRGSAGG